MANKKTILLMGLFGLLLVLCINSTAQATVLYNTTNLTNANNIYQQTVELNKIVDNFIGYGLILIVVVITFTIIAGNYDTLSGLGAGSFIGAVTASILLPLELIQWQMYQYIVLIFGVIVLVTILIKQNS